MCLLSFQGTVEEWRITFYIAGVIYCLGAVVYAFLAKGEVLDWAREEVEEDAGEVEGYPLKELKEVNEEEEATEKDKMVNDPDKKNGVVFE